MDIHGYPWIPGQLFDRRTICLAQPHALTKATRRPQTPPSTIMWLPIFSIKHCNTYVSDFFLTHMFPMLFKHAGLPRFGSVRFRFGRFRFGPVPVRSGSGSIPVPIRFFLIEKSILGSKKKFDFS